MFGSARASSVPALPRLGELRLPGEKPEAQRKAAGELVVAATELKRSPAAPGQATASMLATGVVMLVDDLLDHDLTPYLAKLTDTAHYGELLARADRAPAGRMSEAATAVLCYIGAQFQHEDRLFEQLCRWSLEAGFFTARTGADVDDVLASLRVDMARFLHSVQLPRPRTPAAVPSIPRPRVGMQEHVH
jgi:hypothetical protein